MQGLSRQFPVILGVLNVTPDSFSDGGRWATADEAVRRGAALLAEGADIVDVGGESTRPGAPAVGEAEELDRVVPVVERLVRELDAPISIDTRKVAVARAAVAAGAILVNDVSGGVDPGMARLGAENPHVRFLLMHMQGTPETMQKAPSYPDGVVTEVRRFLAERVAAFEEAGVERARLWVDPGIGFGKTLAHNLTLLRNLDAFSGLAARVAVGTSRKSFLAAIENDPQLPFDDRLPGTLATQLWAYTHGASVFRVHDPRPWARLLRAWRAVEDVDARQS
jgi:dihydropteroate synthase